MKVEMPESEPVKIYGDSNKENPCLKKVEAAESMFFEDYSRRVFDALAIPNNNVIVTGGNGVGKTSLVKHIQHLFDTYNCPSQFFSCEIMELFQLKLSDGIKSVTDYEERLNSVFGYIMD
jgi:ATP-dependent Clp protease ATP-binding subunit ClpA